MIVPDNKSRTSYSETGFWKTRLLGRLWGDATTKNTALLYYLYRNVTLRTRAPSEWHLIKVCTLICFTVFTWDWKMSWLNSHLCTGLHRPLLAWSKTHMTCSVSVKNSSGIHSGIIFLNPVRPSWCLQGGLLKGVGVTGQGHRGSSATAPGRTWSRCWPAPRRDRWLERDWWRPPEASKTRSELRLQRPATRWRHRRAQRRSTCPCRETSSSQFVLHWCQCLQVLWGQHAFFLSELSGQGATQSLTYITGKNTIYRMHSILSVPVENNYKTSCAS